MSGLSRYLLYWRTTVVRDREIVDAVVHPDHRGPSPELRDALAAWPGTRYWADDEGSGRLVLIRSLMPAPPERWWLHITLFVVTFFTVWMSGAILAGAPVRLPAISAASLGPAFVAWIADLRPGLAFAVALMGILLVHELGHYVVAKRYGINTSPPYFLPWPPVFFLSLIGTIGAFIRLRSPIVDRRQLMDVGAAGPWAGFAITVVVLVLGLANSEVVNEVGRTAQVITFPGHYQLYLGDSLVMWGMRRLVAGNGLVHLSPLAFAGWIGLFVTMLNLLPLGQLDGGHVLYALLGEKQGRLGALVFLGMLALSIVWKYWLLWAILVLLLGRGRLSHPSVLDRHLPLPRSRRPLGWATIALFGATFTPAPFLV